MMVNLFEVGTNGRCCGMTTALTLPPHDRTPFPGGAPANVATALSQLGVKCTFFTALGKDEFGDQLVALLEERGVDLSGVQRVEQPTRCAAHPFHPCPCLRPPACLAAELRLRYHVGRDVYVERSINGDRNFAGFGAPADSYADCFIDSAKLPMELIDVRLLPPPPLPVSRHPYMGQPGSTVHL